MRSALYTIMEFDTPDNNYMVLESIKSAPAKVVHVFNLDPRYDSFKVGRSVETDMKIADISVSRTHSFLTVRDGRLYVEDNGSKFGTLVKIQRPQALLRSIDFDVRSTICQIGRTLVYFELDTRDKRVWQMCWCNRKKQFDMQKVSADFLKLRFDSMSIPLEFFNYEDMKMHLKHGGNLPINTNKKFIDQDSNSMDSMEDEQAMNTKMTNEKRVTESILREAR
jgi:hypothetical protein